MTTRQHIVERIFTFMWWAGVVGGCAAIAIVAGFFIWLAATAWPWIEDWRPIDSVFLASMIVTAVYIGLQEIKIKRAHHKIFMLDDSHCQLMAALDGIETPEGILRVYKNGAALKEDPPEIEIQEATEQAKGESLQ